MEEDCKTPSRQKYVRTCKTPVSVGRRSSRLSQTPSLKALENFAVKSVENSPENVRKSIRKVSPSKRYQEEEYETANNKTPRKRRTIQITSDTESKENESRSESDLEFNECSEIKEAELFNEGEDVEGKNVYGFVTPRKRDALLKIASAQKTPRTPKTPKTPKTPARSHHKTPDVKRARSLDLQSKTPSRVRSRVKKEISKQLQESTDEDFSADESEYSPTESEDESDDELNQNIVVSEDEENEVSDDAQHDAKMEAQKRRISIPILPKTPGKRRSARIVTKDYIPECEDYFTTHANKKIITSDHTLDRLKNPRLAADRLFSMLSEMTISSAHEKAVANLLDDYKSAFAKWMFVLNEGFNIVCYGLGSKRRLLQNFHRELLSNQNVIVINGFFPSLTIKDILDGIIDTLGVASAPANPNEAVDLIEEELNQWPENHLFLIVHNIDGPMLRNLKAQDTLSRLAKIQNIHLIASIDHINSPLLWDSVKLNNYNFLWWDTTTMLPYSDETAFENSLMVQNSGELALSSMRSVFLSLTANSRGIYMLIVNYQLKNGKSNNYQGMSFKDLYYACREAFLVSSDLALRAQLTEFLDHKLVRSKRSVDGTELLQIPIKPELLQQFINEQESAQA